MSEQEYQGGERRPIASRDLAISRRTASWLAERGVSPNAISIAGMLAAIAGGFALWGTSIGGGIVRPLWLFAAAMAQLRLLANMFDGMVAIQRQVASPLGELYNEVPDRISDAAMFIGLGFATGGEPLLGCGAALSAVFTAYVRAMAKVAGAPQDFCGPMAKPQRMFVVTVLAVYCALAPNAWQPMWLVADRTFGLASVALAIILIGSLWTAMRRLVRTARYLKAHRQ
ncbi:MAG TPA: CDP-alcohol phosphatidyltransferase family protein [Pirellulaceae bacterium]|jgi:phosphatidylglycerophosphate synthase